MQRLFTLIALVLSLATAPLTVLGADTLPKPEALSEETIFLTEKLSKNYDTIVIKEFSTDGAEYSRVDDEERAKITTMTPMLLSNIALSMEGELKGKKLFKNIIKNGEPKGKAVILEGKITEFNAGSRALKFWVGFGAGKAYLKFKGRLLDAATGKELANFEDRETGYRGAMSMESYEDLFPHQAKSIGENLAKFLEKLY
jgi:hypothetical protein